MPKIPYFPFYASDWLGSRTVRLMTDAQKGIYIDLLAFAWTDPGCVIPADRKQLQKMLPGSRWSNIEKVLSMAWTRDGDRWRNERGSVEHSRALAKSDKMRESANCRWNKEKRNADAMQLQCKGNNNQNQNQNQIKEEAGQKTPAAKKKQKMTDEEWLQMVKSNPAYQGLDVDLVFAKLQAWCATKGRKPTRARFLNWLNREEKPLTGGQQHGLQTSSIGRSGGDRAKQMAREMLGLRGTGSRSSPKLCGGPESTKDPGRVGELAQGLDTAIIPSAAVETRKAD